MFFLDCWQYYWRYTARISEFCKQLMSFKRALDEESSYEISLHLDEKCSRGISYSSQIVFFQSLYLHLFLQRCMCVGSACFQDFASACSMFAFREQTPRPQLLLDTCILQKVVPWRLVWDIESEGSSGGMWQQVRKQNMHYNGHTLLVNIAWVKMCWMQMKTFVYSSSLIKSSFLQLRYIYAFIWWMAFERNRTWTKEWRLVGHTYWAFYSSQNHNWQVTYKQRTCIRY